MRQDKLPGLIALALLAIAAPALASDIGKPSPEALEGLYPGKTYSPYAQRSFPSQLLWGDTHVHTRAGARCRVVWQHPGP